MLKTTGSIILQIILHANIQRQVQKDSAKCFKGTQKHKNTITQVKRITQQIAEMVLLRRRRSRLST